MPKAAWVQPSGSFSGSAHQRAVRALPLLTPGHGARLLEQWRPHSDLTRPVLVEKSPPNLPMTRFLQGAFPDARFMIVVRHPAIVSLSTASGLTCARSAPCWTTGSPPTGASSRTRPSSTTCSWAVRAPGRRPRAEPGGDRRLP
jgi:hypothetical protein